MVHASPNSLSGTERSVPQYYWGHYWTGLWDTLAQANRKYIMIHDKNPV